MPRPISARLRPGPLLLLAAWLAIGAPLGARTAPLAPQRAAERALGTPPLAPQRTAERALGTPPLADASDRAAFRQWFVLLADLQFEHRAPEVVDCAALVRFAYREALRPHTPEWARRIGLPMTPMFPDVRSGPRPGPDGWPLFKVSDAPELRYGEFADARTIVRLNARRLGRDVRAARPGDLLYFLQPAQREPDHVMVFVGPSLFDPDASDWVVYHTGPDDESPGEVRKVRLADLVRHPAPRWRPVSTNPHFVGVFRLSLL